MYFNASTMFSFLSQHKHQTTTKKKLINLSKITQTFRSLQGMVINQGGRSREQCVFECLWFIYNCTIKGNNTDKATFTVFRENPYQISHST